jgi:hypothetical protein
MPGCSDCSSSRLTWPVQAHLPARSRETCAVPGAAYPPSACKQVPAITSPLWKPIAAMPKRYPRPWQPFHERIKAAASAGQVTMVERPYAMASGDSRPAIKDLSQVRWASRCFPRTGAKHPRENCCKWTQRTRYTRWGFRRGYYCGVN